MQQPGILQPAEPDSLSIGHRRFTEVLKYCIGALKKGRSRHIRLPVPGFLNAKKAIKKGDVA
jgi:hypothetical protein